MENTGLQISGALSDRHGRFKMRDVHPGTIRLYAYKVGVAHDVPYQSSTGGDGKTVWTAIRVTPEQRWTYVELPLGPKPGVLKLTVEDEDGAVSDGRIHFERRDASNRRLQLGHSLNGNAVYFILPDRQFQFKIMRNEYETWHSKDAGAGEWLSFKSGEVSSITAKLKKSR